MSDSAKVVVAAIVGIVIINVLSAAANVGVERERTKQIQIECSENLTRLEAWVDNYKPRHVPPSVY